MELPHLTASVAKDRLQIPIEEWNVSDINIDDFAEPVRACILALANVRTKLPQLQDYATFDGEMAVTLHRTAKLPLAHASDIGFWRWLAVEHGRDLVVFRHSESASLANYGIGRQWDNLLMRSWFRADLSCDRKSEDPYALTKRGGSDFWASGVVRHRYSSARNVVRALIRFQFNGDDPFNGRFNTDKIREIYKRIRHIQATVSLELLTDDECDELLRELARDLV